MQNNDEEIKNYILKLLSLTADFATEYNKNAPVIILKNYINSIKDVCDNLSSEFSLCIGEIHA